MVSMLPWQLCIERNINSKMAVAHLLEAWQLLAREAAGPEYVLSKTYEAVHSALFDFMG